MVHVKSYWKVPESQIKKGTKIEMEHTNSKKVARRIALDHLKEHPRYYDYLEEAENKMKKDLED